MATATMLEPAAQSQGQKRGRSWEVDISLEELVSSDVLEMFMQEIPGGGGGEWLGSGLSGDVGLGHLSADSFGLGVPSSDALLLRGGDGSSLGAAMRAGSYVPSGAMSSGSCSDGLSHGLPRPAALNAASLAQSLYPGWGGVPTSTPSIQPGHSMLGSVSWGSELLPSILGTGDVDQAVFGSSSPNAGIDIGLGPDTTVSGGRSVHKTRFVWTAELHRRFEAAVNTLGIDHAKPQAISQLMNCEGEGAPTRQNIKSHLQKYRLLMQKRARMGPGGPGDAGEGSGDGAEIKRTDSSNDAEKSSQHEPSDVQSQLEQHLARQEMNLKVQMELQTKLHRQLLVQRQLQHQLDHSLNSPAELDATDKQRWQATVSLKNNLRERLTKHVIMQQEMLHHLDALVSSEVNKPGAEEKSQTADSALGSAENLGEEPVSAQSSADPPIDTIETVKSESASLQ
ncbi:hypothetical protein AB1Y20_016908 [Prymnesium parvum]|uniref:HTH myb-type domain-containing protein n=1 Tax=Prymnesium parvum TaxID=97485 RepID=A0AB34IDE8_PRYPA